MLVYDLCVAWNWVFDTDFINLLDLSCKSRGLSLLQITPSNLPQMLNSLAAGEVGCRVFFDRASDEDVQFLPLVQWVSERSIYSINSYERASRTWNKADIHAVLVANGINVPRTIILPPFFNEPVLSEIDLSMFEGQFTIKPAHGGGGVGVLTNASSWDQVLAARKEHANDQYLLQAHVNPIVLEMRPAWFRVIYCAGKVNACWWNPSSHVYSQVSDANRIEYKLEPLEEIAVKIARLCGLELFSTEIACTADGKFVVVDYINDQIDLRLQSSAAEGVPDEIVREVAYHLTSHVANFT